MREIILGKSGIAVSAVGLGGIQFSKITRQAVAKVIHAAIDEGITFLETAHGYFDSEKKMGSVLRGRLVRLRSGGRAGLFCKTNPMCPSFQCLNPKIDRFLSGVVMAWDGSRRYLAAIS